MGTFRILHVSDLHFAEREGVVGFPDVLPPYPRGHHLGLVSSYDEDLAFGVARFAFENRGRIDAVLATGDLATTGEAADLEVARRFFLDPPTTSPLSARIGNREAARIGGLGIPLLMMPGNHDRFAGRPLCCPASRAFDRVFRSRWHPRRGVQTLEVLQAEDGSCLALVAADLALADSGDAEGAFGYLGQGRAYPRVLGALERETREVRAKYAAAVVWAIHFPPRFVDVADSLRLLDDTNLIDAARSAGVPLVLSGHTHDPRDYPKDGSHVRVLCAGSATQFSLSKGNWLYLVAIEVAGGDIGAVGVEAFQWDDEKDRVFMPAPIPD